MESIMNYFYILLTIIFTVYGQLVIKWQMSYVEHLPNVLEEKILFLLRLCINPWVMSSFVAAFLAALNWMLAMTKFELSYAYPFTSLAFVLVFIFSSIFFNEVVTASKIFGIMLIVSGIVLVSKG